MRKKKEDMFHDALVIGGSVTERTVQRICGDLCGIAEVCVFGGGCGERQR